jgi:hypothetical protein
MYSFTLTLTSAQDGVGWSTPRPDRFNPGKTRYPLNRRLGWPQRRAGTLRKISPPPKIENLLIFGITERHEQCIALCSVKWKVHYIQGGTKVP